MSAAVDQPLTLTVVVPVFNEAENLAALHRRLADALQPTNLCWDVLYVDDGSTDQSLPVIRQLAADEPTVGWLSLSRNFGKELAMTAGLDHTSTDAVVIIDADLQDPPELIPALIERWREGYDVVYAQRTARAGESLVKRGWRPVFIGSSTGFPEPGCRRIPATSDCSADAPSRRWAGFGSAIGL